MKNNFKKIVAGLCALTMIPCLSVYAENASSIMSAKAGSPFIVSINDENNDIKFDESQINVTIEKIEPFTISGTAKDVKHNTSNNVISGSFSGSKYVERISFEIKAANTSVDDLKKAYMGFNSSRTIKGEIHKGGLPRDVSECIKTGEDTYILHFDGWDNGETYNFQIQGLDNINGLEVKSYTVSSESTYYKVEATCLDGNGICAFLPTSEGLNNENITKWAKNQCLLANSQNHITNNSHEVIYYYFNCPIGYADAKSFSWTNCNDNSLIYCGRIRFNKDATKEELELIKLNGNSFNYFTMHEMGHIYGSDSDFSDAFKFKTYTNDRASDNDEYYTNVRALTALQNCENINNYKVRKENNSMKKMELFSYNEVYDVNYNYKNVDDYVYYIARSFTKCCDWNKLEKFYRAEFAPKYDSVETIAAANVLVETLGITIEDFDDSVIKGKKGPFLKFVNMLYWLYSLSTEMEYCDESFIKFIDETFVIEKADVTGLECIKKMLVHENICNPIILKQKPQNAIAPMGSEVKTVVEAEGNDLKYQWYLCEPGEDEFIKSSVTRKSYSYTMTKAKNGRKVYCVITDANDNTVTTDTVTLYMGNPLTITNKPVNTSAEYGQEVKVRVAANGDGLTYKWYYKNKGDSEFHYTKTFDNRTTYSVEMNEERDGRQIYCEITDKYGFTIQTDIVTIGLPVVITEDLVNTAAELGEKVKLTVSATGHGLTYEWHYKNKNMKKFDVTESFKTDTYSLDKMTEARAGREVYCVITDIFGNSVQTKTVTIGLPAEITKDLVDVTAKFGEQVNFSVSATGHGLTYEWYYKNENMKDFALTSSFKTNKYELDKITKARAGREVYCVITDIFGNSVQTKTIKIDLPTGYGDANCDGVVDAKDADAILKAYANSDKNALTPQGEKNADVSGDGGVTPDDALLIQQYLSN